MSYDSPQPESQTKRLAVPLRNRIDLFKSRIHMQYTLLLSCKPYVIRVLSTNWKVPIMALIVFVMLIEVLWSLRGLVVFLFGVYLVLMVRKGS
jgi:hypothetical protein